MNIAIYIEGDEKFSIDLPDNTKEVDFSFSHEFDWIAKVSIKRIEFYDSRS